MKAAPDDQALLLDLQQLDTTSPASPTAPRPADRRPAHRRHDASRLRSRWRPSTAPSRTPSPSCAASSPTSRPSRPASPATSSDCAGTSSVKDVPALESELAALASAAPTSRTCELEVMERSRPRPRRRGRGRARPHRAPRADARATRDAKLGELEVERRRSRPTAGTLAAKVPADLLALYERQRERYGTGASLLRAGVSSASGVTLTGSDLAAVRSAPPTTSCSAPTATRSSSARRVRHLRSALGAARGRDTATMVERTGRQDGRVGRGLAPGRRGTSGLHRAGRWATPTRGDPRDSATESRPPRSSPRGAAGVRVKRRCKPGPVQRLRRDGPAMSDRLASASSKVKQRTVEQPASSADLAPGRFTERVRSPGPLVVSYTTVSPLPRVAHRRSALCGDCPADGSGWVLPTALLWEPGRSSALPGERRDRLTDPFARDQEARLRSRGPLRVRARGAASPRGALVRPEGAQAPSRAGSACARPVPRRP